MQPDTLPASTYDLVAYPSYTHAQTHPGRLGVIGHLFGLAPARADACRVLELGCGNGSNLVPMAEGFAGSEFVGIDLAALPIAGGQRMIADLGLTNVRLVQGNLTEVNADWGKFDYIIAHGLYSWVPPGLQTEILRLCRDRLNPRGLAFISYNALPGSHLRMMLREMMLFHTRGFADPSERIRQARALAKFLAESQNTRDEYQLWMKAELERILEHDAGHIFHDELSDENHPCSFTQFIQLAGQSGLQYVGEADFFEMFAHGFTEATQQRLAQLGNDRLRREQYLDFLKCRRFRQTLLCHQEVTISSEPQADAVLDFLVASPARCTSDARQAPVGATRVYQTPKGATCSTDFLLGQAALGILEQRWPLPLPFSELFELAARPSSTAGINPAPASGTAQTLAAFLLQLFGAGLVDFRTCLQPIARVAGEYPVVSPVARWQARHGDVVTSRFHMAVKVEDEVGRFLLTYLDGSLNRAALVEKMRESFVLKEPLALAGQDETAVGLSIKQDLERNLAKLAGMGLLVA
jgi:SAM-dependent methyltransferase